jgi:adenylate cyclase
MLRKQVVRISVGLAIVVAMLACATGRLSLPPLAALERTLYDARLRLTMPNTPDQRIAIVDIDEKSLAVIGRWPWRRDRMAQLLDQLFDRYQARVVGLDIIMAERDDSAGLGALDALANGALRDNAPFTTALARMRPQLDLDGAFAAALRKHRVVLGFYLANEGVSSGAVPAPAIDAHSMAGHAPPVYGFANHGGNLPQFQAAATGGHVNPVIDPDGSVRRVPLLVRHDGQYYEAFSLALARAYLGDALLQPRFASGASDAAVESLDLVGPSGRLASAPVDDRLAAWVPYRGRAGSFPYVSAADVLAGTIPPDSLRGRIVIVGTTAPGLRDMRTTPVGEIYPGMEVHANLVGGMLDGRILQRPDYSDALDVLQLLLLGGLMLFAVCWQRPFVASLNTLGLLAAVVAVNLSCWSRAQLIVPLATPLALGVFLYAWNMTYGYFMETRAKLRISQRFAGAQDDRRSQPLQHERPPRRALGPVFRRAGLYQHRRET